MKKDSFVERCSSSENRDYMLTLSTQSQDDEQIQHVQQTSSNSYNHNQNLQLFLLEEDSTSKINTATTKLGIKNTTTRKEKLSLVLNEITRAATNHAKITLLSATTNDGLEKNKESSQSNRWINEDKDYELRLQRLRKSSIVSIYCKQNDITFVSSPEEFALKVIGNRNKLEEEENPHISQLQIELIISNKDGEEESHSVFSSIQPVTKNSVSIKIEEQLNKEKKNNQQSSVFSQKDKLNSSSNKNLEKNKICQNEQEEEDDDIDFLISSPSNNSLQKAIEEHTSLLKQYQYQTQQLNKNIQNPTDKITAYDLLLSLQFDIEKY